MFLVVLCFFSLAIQGSKIEKQDERIATLERELKSAESAIAAVRYQMQATNDALVRMPITSGPALRVEDLPKPGEILFLSSSGVPFTKIIPDPGPPTTLMPVK